MESSRKRNASRKTAAKRKIEGGEFTIVKKINLDADTTTIVPFVRGLLDDKLTWYIRQYLDMAMSSALYAMAFSENTHLQFPSTMSEKKKYIGSKDITAAIPGTVYNMLRYNGCQFANIGFYPASVDLPEPIWYSINTESNSLVLFVNESMIDSFCRKPSINSDLVQIEPGAIKLSSYNLLQDNIANDLQRFIPAARKLVILCDHVSQHIISEIHNPNIPKASKLHDPQFFSRTGTTIHSMFKLTQIATKAPELNLAAQTTASPFFQTTNLITNQCKSTEYTDFLDKLVN